MTLYRDAKFPWMSSIVRQQEYKGMYPQIRKWEFARRRSCLDHDPPWSPDCLSTIPRIYKLDKTEAKHLASTVKLRIKNVLKPCKTIKKIRMIERGQRKVKRQKQSYEESKSKLAFQKRQRGRKACILSAL